MNQRSLGRYFDHPDLVFELVNGSQMLVLACNTLGKAGVVGRLLEAPASAAQLAAACQLPVEQLRRLLDLLVAHEIVEKSGAGVYCATDRTGVLADALIYLRSTEVGTLAGSRLLDALRQGDVTPFELYYGQPAFAYFGAHPDKAAIFGQFMGWMTRRMTRFLFAEHRFERFETVADIGGSMGDLLLALMEEYPGTRGILFDLPETAELARPRIAASPHAERVEVVGGSFFEAVPAADLYTLKQILHDWSDPECELILRNVRAAIRPGGRLAVIDHIMSDPPAPDEASSTDIAMMIWDNGHERRLAEFEALFAKTGFRVERVSRNPDGHSVIEGVPV